ncbi:hypothetical protein HA039_06715 [Streptomyces liangshanensis]|uniref:Uncharacterized protein n=1 Tax=Streptomyces liangshanensis TaxID=2717324 RepID=A0A6G9GUT9_9ACTN|nr:hypothetical protein HA039_06715 [Streptomyces liangshanensis]
MGRLGQSVEQQAKVRMYYVMASVASVVLLVSGVAIGIMGNPAGWVLCVVAVALWLGLSLTIKYTRQAQP